MSVCMCVYYLGIWVMMRGAHLQREELQMTLSRPLISGVVPFLNIHYSSCHHLEQSVSIVYSLSYF